MAGLAPQLQQSSVEPAADAPPVEPHPLQRTPTEAGVDRCKNGHEAAADAAFCPRCGQPVARAEASKPVAVQELGNGVLNVQPIGHDAAPSKAHKKLLMVAFPLLLLAGAVGWYTLKPSTESHSIAGTIKLTNRGEGWEAGDYCEGTSGYDDIFAGQTVTVSNQGGTVIGTGSLGPGTAGGIVTCLFRFRVDELPKESFYNIEVSHRGGLTYSIAELEGMGWKVDLTLGD